MVEPRVSVIALFDRGSFDPCLPSLFLQSLPDFEVIAVTGAEPAAPPADPRVRVLVAADRNPARRRNLAAGAARAPVLAFIDDDAAAPPDWLAGGLGFLDRHPEAAGVGGPNLRFTDAAPAELISDMLLTTPFIGGGSRAYRGGGAVAPARPGELHLVNLFVRAEAWRAAGGLDETMGYGAEDTEFLARAQDGGARFFFDPALWVRHRRRPFGPGYVAQRLRLRAQSGRLLRRRPMIYAENSAFWLTLLAPFLVALIFWMGGPAPWLALAAYAAGTIILSKKSWRERPWLLPLAPFVFVIHHTVYAVGLWAGLVDYLAARR